MARPLLDVSSVSTDSTLSHATKTTFYADDEICVFAVEEEITEEDALLLEADAPASQRETLPAPPDVPEALRCPEVPRVPTLASFVGLCAAGWAAAAALTVLLTDAPLSVLVDELSRALP